MRPRSDHDVDDHRLRDRGERPEHREQPTTYEQAHRPGGSGQVRPAEPDRTRPAEPDRTRTVAEQQREPGRPTRDVVLDVLGAVWRVSRVVFLVLAAVVLLALVFTLAPTNEENVIVRNVLDLAATVAGPFMDVFATEEPRRTLIYNYALATAVYLAAAALVTRLPGGRRSS